MNHTLTAFVWRDMTRRPWQTALMLVGVVLGVAVMVSIDVANASARRGFDLSTEAVAGQATHQILGGSVGVPEAVYEDLRRGLGWQASAPIVEAIAVAPDLEGRPLRVVGIDPLADSNIRPTFGRDSWAQPEAARFYLDPRAVILHAGLAESHGISPGDRLGLVVDDRIVELSVMGVWTPAGDDPGGALEDIAWMDIAAAQELFGMVGRLSRIDLIAGEGDLHAIEGLLPPGAEIVPASEQTEAVRQLSEAFQLNLTALSLLALVVGMFLIYNSMMFNVVQRRQVLATLSVLGVEPGSILRVILAEAAWVGIVGAIVGLPLGWLLAQGAVHLVTRTINDLYFTLSVRQAALLPESVGRAVILSLGAALIAAAGPALEASRVPPVAAMRRSELEAGTSRWIARLAAAGVALFLAGGAALIAARTSLAVSLGGMFGVLVGLAFLVPAAVSGLLGALEWGLRRQPASSLRWAIRSVRRSLSRTSVALAALMVALAVTIGLGVMIANFRATVDEWLGLTLRADLYVSTPLGSGSRPEGDIGPEWEGRLGSLADVANVEPFRAVVVGSEFGPVQLSVVEGSRTRDAGLYRFAEGTAEEVWGAVQGGAAIVSESFALTHRLGPGAHVTLQTDRGDRTFPVAAVFYDYTTGQGTVMITQEVYHRLWDDRHFSSLGVFLAPQADPALVADSVRAELSGSGLRVTSHQELRRRALEIFDRSFAVTSALRWLAVLVAGVGILSALLALQLERGRELATLQVIGMTPAGLGRLTLLETGLMGLLAGLLSIPTGLVLAWILTQVINQRSFGWTIPWVPSPEPIAVALLLGLAASTAASIYPWWRLSRLPLTESLRAE